MSMSAPALSTSAPRESTEIERIEQRVRDHLQSTQNAVDLLYVVLNNLRGERGADPKQPGPKPVRPGLIGTIETEQDDLANRLEILHGLIHELRNIA